MKKVLFYYHSDWVFGKIHTELSKALYPDFYCDLLCWDKQISNEEMEMLNSKYDFFVSLPERCFELNYKYRIPAWKLIGILHSDWDIYRPLHNDINPILFTQLRGYAAICPMLINASISHGIPRIPDLLKIGLFTDNYKKPISQNISNLGYLQIFFRSDYGFDIKRGNLIKTISELTGLNFVHRNDFGYLAVDQAYSNIDLYMFASLTEGNPYAALEAFAAGIPVLGTDTGIFKEIVKSGGGKILPFQENRYIEEALKTIKILRQDHNQYIDMSQKAMEESKKFDWSVIRNDWISYFNSI